MRPQSHTCEENRSSRVRSLSSLTNYATLNIRILYVRLSALTGYAASKPFTIGGVFVIAGWRENDGSRASISYPLCPQRQRQPCRTQNLKFLAWAVYKTFWPSSLVCLAWLQDLLGRMLLTISQIYQRANVRTWLIQICAGCRLDATLSEIYIRRLSFCRHPIFSYLF